MVDKQITKWAGQHGSSHGYAATGGPELVHA